MLIVLLNDSCLLLDVVMMDK